MAFARIWTREKTLNPHFRLLWILLLKNVVAVAASSVKLDIAQCRTSLGMQLGGIKDEHISASSSYDYASVGPINARIRTEKNGGAWCPKPSITPHTYEYLEVNLVNLTVITLVETQGRFGNGQGQEYTEQYLLDYWRDEEQKWMRFKNRRGQEIFQANSNTYLAVLRKVDPPIIAKKIRFVPYSTHARTVCMRVELYGCPWQAQLLSYSMPRGDKRGVEIDMADSTYDGKDENGFLVGGLGQLTDGQEGHSNFRLDPQNIGMKGYEWVGWKNESGDRKPVEIYLKFDSIRNFSSISIHCNNFFSKDVRVFRSAEVYFSVGGQWFSSDPTHFQYMRDELMEFARWVKIRIPYRVGRFMKLVLRFDARWILISEISVESERAVGNFTVETAPPPTQTPSGDNRSYHQDEFLDGDQSNKRNYSYPVYVSKGNDGGRYKPWDTSGGEVNVARTNKTLDTKEIGLITGAVVLLLIFIILIVMAICWRRRRRKHNNNRRNVKPTEKHVTVNLNDLRPNIVVNGKLSNGNMYNSIMNDGDSDRDIDRCNNDVYHDLDEYLQRRILPDVPMLKTPDTTDTNTITSRDRDYAIPDVTKSSLMVTLPSAPCMENPYMRTPIKVDPFYADESLGDMPNIQGVSGNTTYAIPATELLGEDDEVVEFPRENLNMLEKLGEGQFGEVHLCEAQKLIELATNDAVPPNKSLLVAVKMLRGNASDQAQNDFQKEIKIMSRLRDPNIVRVLGICSKTDTEPPMVIVEYMKFGDLNQFLQQHVPENIYGTAKVTNAPVLTHGCLIYMATQIASGMKYLESLNMVHRDLASRNCLVGHQYSIKISDFGMSRSLYSSDYYKIEGRAVLPIRWMAWESVLLGKFTSKTDVWSFAVTLWEILTFAKIQPYEHLSDEKVIENCGHFYRQDGQEIYLPIPAHCPKEIYDLMRECWNRDDLYRPAFREIHMFLQRKNMGYNPKDELMSQGKMVLC